MILCSGDTAATYKFSEITLENDAIFDKPYTTQEMIVYCNSIDFIYQGNYNPLPDTI